ncbi:MAG: PIN domain-containing protein [Sedimentisphaerales bacterium]|nr:PIN domain-containing protein [Sedimentisphaerales bacterium]
MKVLVDTCIWSIALRRKNPDTEIIQKLQDLIKDDRVSMIGPIRQEILSGISNGRQFHKLKKILSAFEDILLVTEHYEAAAEFSNICRSKGIQGSTIDFLICAVAHMENLEIFTSDTDFENYSRYLPIELMK